MPEPSRGEGFGFLVEIPKIDFMSRAGEPCTKYFRRALPIEATPKTYRFARFKNLTFRAGEIKSGVKPLQVARTGATLKRDAIRQSGRGRFCRG